MLSLNNQLNLDRLMSMTSVPSGDNLNFSSGRVSRRCLRDPDREDTVTVQSHPSQEGLHSGNGSL